MRYSFLILIGLLSCNNSKQDYSERSRILFNNGEYQNCLNLSNNLPSYKLTQAIHVHRAWSYAHLGLADSASVEFGKVLALDSLNQNAIMGLMQFHPDVAIRINYGFKYLKFQEDSSTIARVYQNIGHSYKTMKEFDYAIQYYDSSINYLGKELSNDDAYIYYKKGLVQYYGGHFEEAELSFSKYLTFNSDSVAVWLLTATKDSIQHHLAPHSSN